MHPERVALGDVDRWYRSMVRYLAWELMPLLRAGLTTAGGQRFSLWREGLGRLRGRGEVYDGLYREVYLKMYRRLQPLYKKIRSITGYPP